MIDITEFIPALITPTGVDAWFQTHPTGTLPAQYVTFIEISALPDLEAADREITTNRHVQLNVWSRGNYFTLVESIKKAMEAGGFDRTYEADGPYTDGDSHFNKILRFEYTDEY